jgi:hypothetical protein
MNRLASGEISRIKFVVLVFIAILFTGTGIAQTDLPFLKKHEGDYVGVPLSASVALLSAQPGDTDLTQDAKAVDLRELERRTRQMVDARAQEEALLRADAQLSIRQVSNVWQIALKFEGAPTYGALRNISFKFEEGTVPGQIVPAQSSTYGASTVGGDGRSAAIALGPRAWTDRATSIPSKYYCAAQTKG